IQWLDRRLDDQKFWALAIGKISGEKYGHMYVALGINDQNQNQILDVNSDGFSETIAALLERGLNPELIRITVIPSDPNLEKSVLESFPETEINYDWMPIRERYPEIKNLWNNPNRTVLLKELGKRNLSLNYLSYLNYDQVFWRSLRSLWNIFKFEQEFNRRIEPKEIQTDEQILSVLAWTVIKFNIYWSRFPLDSKA